MESGDSLFSMRVLFSTRNPEADQRTKLELQGTNHLQAVLLSQQHLFFNMMSHTQFA